MPAHKNPHRPIIKYLVRTGELTVKYIEAELGRMNLGELATSHTEIVTYLIRKGSASMQELAAALERDKSTITVLVRKLENLGFIKRESGSDDARVTLIRLTPGGAALRSQALKAFLRTERALTQNLSADETEQLFVLLEKVYRGLTNQNR